MRAPTISLGDGSDALALPRLVRQRTPDDCMQAATACILDRPYDQVPAMGSMHRRWRLERLEWWEAYSKRLKPLGYCLRESDVQSWVDTPHVLIVKIQGWRHHHAVVAREQIIAWCPTAGFASKLELGSIRPLYRLQLLAL